MSDGSMAQRLALAGLDWIVPQWSAPSSVHALSTTRNEGARHSIDFAPANPAIDQARSSLRQFVPAEPMWLAQQHGTRVVDADQVHAQAPRADAAVARVPRKVCAILSGDCLPVLLAARDGSVVAAAHAGWRGLAAGVLEATVRSMRIAPDELVAWMGPSIGASAFEVGDEVRAAFCDRDAAATTAFSAGRPGKWFADLHALARQRLARAGVVEVSGVARCTFTETASFYSYRRGGADASGRMATLIWRDQA
jgi:purine-nucleoside/S-methyl-5'-thioadenosine phosphorylase / adenosine deaminase